MWKEEPACMCTRAHCRESQRKMERKQERERGRHKGREAGQRKGGESEGLTYVLATEESTRYRTVLHV